jgi:hypothetical protein
MTKNDKEKIPPFKTEINSFSLKTGKFYQTNIATKY